MSMADTSTGSTSTQGPPDWFVKPCKWLWKKQGFIWGTIVLGIALNVLAFYPLAVDCQYKLRWNAY